MKIKNWQIGLLATLFLVFTLGFITYRNFNSVENQSKRALRSEITDWYYHGISLTYDGPSKNKSNKGKESAIEIRRTKDRLNNNWNFVSENYEIKEIGYSAMIVDYDYIFENTKTNEQRLYSDRYYYELDEPMPIPLKEDVTSITDNYKTIKSARLWNGDFDAFCMKPKESSTEGEVQW